MIIWYKVHSSWCSPDSSCRKLTWSASLLLCFSREFKPKHITNGSSYSVCLGKSKCPICSKNPKNNASLHHIGNPVFLKSPMIFLEAPEEVSWINPDFCMQLYSASALGLHLLLLFCYFDYYFSLLGYNPFFSQTLLHVIFVRPMSHCPCSFGLFLDCQLLQFFFLSSQ